MGNSVYNNVKIIYELMYYYFEQFRFKLGFLPKGTRDHLRNYWMSPPDKGNKPEGYASCTGKGRSEFLVELVKSLAPQPAAILEIGCNVGRNLNYLLGENYSNLTGIEISTQAVVEMKRYFPGLATTANIINSPVESVLPSFADKQFDLVFTMAVLVHIPPESKTIFPEIARIARHHIITIEDEHHHSVRHFPRNYRKIFSELGFNETDCIRGDKIEQIGLPRAYVARVFRRV